MALNYVTVTGTFDDGSGSPLPAAGGRAYCQFTPNQAVYASGVPLITPAQPITASINNGSMSVQLLATDNAGLTFGGLTGFFFWTVTLVLNGIQQPSWSFFLPHTPSPVDLSTLINTAAGGGGGGFANPMTTLGDLISGGASGAAVRLAGDTSNTRKFLRELSSGGVAAAPVWDTIQAGDLPAGVGLRAWQFLPETYGAKGDGRVVSDLVLNGTTTATSATAGFTSADTGKTIMINGGLGSAAAPLVTTITFVNSTTVTLGSAAGASGTGFVGVYGTDDTASINSAVSAAGTYALANNYFAEIVFGAKTYVLATGPAQTGNGSTTPTFNAQIPLPYPNANGTSRKLVIALTGAGDAGFVQYWESTTPNLAGTVLVSMTTAPSTPSATFGNQSVIGGPSGSAGFTGGFANVKASVNGLQVVCGAYTNQYAYDFGYLSAMRIEKSSAHIFAPSGVNGGNGPLLKDLPSQVAFQSTIGVGLRTPVTGNNADTTADDFTVEGYARALYVFDHFTASRIFTFYNDVALKIDLTQGISGVSHGVFIALLGAEVYNGGISTNGSGAYCPVYINFDTEVLPNPAYDVSDTGNNLHGIIRWTDPADARNPVVTGAANLRFVNDKLGPAVVPPVVSLTFGASIAVNATFGNVFAVTLTASTGTLANPTNPQDGQVIRVRVVQDATGGRTLAYGTAYNFGAAGPPTLSTAANKVDILGFEYVASLSKWCFLGSGLGF